MSMTPGSTMKALVALPKDPADCWQWLGSITVDGYPRKNTAQGDTTAQRWLWQQLFGPIPRGFVVQAACGNRTCMNPYHFNCCHKADSTRAGVGATLVPGDVRALREIPRGDRNITEARRQGERLGVSPKTVVGVWGNHGWKRKPAAIKPPVATNRGTP